MRGDEAGVVCDQVPQLTRRRGAQHLPSTEPYHKQQKSWGFSADKIIGKKLKVALQNWSADPMIVAWNVSNYK